MFQLAFVSYAETDNRYNFFFSLGICETCLHLIVFNFSHTGKFVNFVYVKFLCICPSALLTKQYN